MMRHSVVIVGLIAVVAATMVISGGTDAVGTSEARAIHRPTTVLVTFLGLVAFADGPSTDKTRALLVDARNESQVEDPTGCQIPIPRHEAFIAFAPPEGREIVPDYVPWVLNNDDVTIVATDPDYAADRERVRGTVKMSALGLQVDATLLEPSMPDRLVGRITFSGGRFVETSHLGRKFVRKLNGSGTPVPIEETRLGVTYRIDAESVSMRRAGQPGLTMANGVWRVVISNQPVVPATRCGDVDPRQTDVHFDWLYRLAEDVPIESARGYPHLGNVRVPGDPCVGGDF